MLFPLKIALFSREIALFYRNSNTNKFDHLWTLRVIEPIFEMIGQIPAWNLQDVPKIHSSEHLRILYVFQEITSVRLALSPTTRFWKESSRPSPQTTPRSRSKPLATTSHSRFSWKISSHLEGKKLAKSRYGHYTLATNFSSIYLKSRHF